MSVLFVELLQLVLHLQFSLKPLFLQNLKQIRLSAPPLPKEFLSRFSYISLRSILGSAILVRRTLLSASLITQL
jgi:hypothetical protein